MQQFLSVVVAGLTTGSLYALIAVGFTLIYATTRSLNFAQGQLFSLSAYATFGLMAAIGSASRLPLALVLLLCLAVGVAAGLVAGIATERLAFWPFSRRAAPRLAPVLVTFGIAIVVDNLLFLRFQTNSQVVTIPSGIPTWHVRGVAISSLAVVLVLGTLVLSGALDHYLAHAKQGKAMRAASLDPEAASVMGINVGRIILGAFAISGALAGFAGAVSTLQYQVIDPFMGSRYTLYALVAAVAGGLGSTRGGVAAGLFLGLVSQAVSSYGWSQWTDAVFFGALALILLVSPRGIVGERSVTARV